MKLLIVGHRGYLGPVIAQHFKEQQQNAELYGYDTHWFIGSEASSYPDALFAKQLNIDVRDVTVDHLHGMDVVVQLAAVSNDPIGKEFEAATQDINTLAALRVARAARTAGVPRFVFASSCSMYGAGADSPRRETDALSPLTAYARSKVATEEGLRTLAGPEFQVTSLRFATACGASPMLRLDLVLNDFVATALRTGRIHVLSDGTPWRPLIHVADMARAIEWAAGRTGEPMLEVNVGSAAWTWQIGQLAREVAEVLGGVEIDINYDAAPDRRSYRVDFSRFQGLAPKHQPVQQFGAVVHGLAEQIANLDFAGESVRSSRFIRLNRLRELTSTGRLGDDLRWRSLAMQ